MKVEKGLKKLKLDLADLVAPKEEKRALTSQIEQLSEQASSLPLGKQPT